MSDRIPVAEMANMDLRKSAEAETEHRTASKLEPHREAIFTLRRKHWTYGQIAKWLNEHGVAVTLWTFTPITPSAFPRRSLMPIRASSYGVVDPSRFALIIQDADAADTADPQGI